MTYAWNSPLTNLLTLDDLNHVGAEPDYSMYGGAKKTASPMPHLEAPKMVIVKIVVPKPYKAPKAMTMAFSNTAIAAAFEAAMAKKKL